MAKTFLTSVSKIELLLVGLLLILLTALTLPAFGRFRCRAMQSEAQYVLQSLYNAEKLYHAETGHYATLQELIQADRLGVLPMHYYRYDTIGAPSQNYFRIDAFGNKGTQVEGEHWAIDNNHELLHVVNKCY